MAILTLIDYGSGNLHSANRALIEAARLSGDDTEIVITADATLVARADRVVLPGVGHFASCAEGLRACDGMVEALEEAVMTRGVPFLGICVGMQLLAEEGLEDGHTSGLGWIPGTVARIVAAVADRNIFGTQFHPEKSQHVGLQLLSNFLKWAP